MLVTALAVPYFVTSPTWRTIFLLMVLFAGLASGLNILVGFTGLLDLGYIAFYAVGAYTAALISVRLVVGHFGVAFYTTHLWWLPYADVIPGAVVAAIVAAVLGYPTLRARGDYLAIMTLGLGEVVRLVAINWGGLTNGPNGIPAIPPFAFGTTQFFNPLPMYYVALALTGALLVLVWRLEGSHVARVWRTIREDDLVAESMGIRVPRYKLLAYVCGGVIAGSIGVLYAHTQGFINPDSFSLDDNFVVLALVIVGGSGTILGPILGAALWVGFDQWVATTGFVQANPEMRDLLLGLLVLVVLIWRPSGIIARRVPARALASDEEAPPAFHPVVGRTLSGTTSTVMDPPVPGPSVKSHPRNANSVASGELVGESLRCDYGGVTAVRDVDIQLQPGEILGIIGPNGAGKTSLINMLTGVEQPRVGRLLVDGVPVQFRRPSDATRHGVSRTFQLIRVLREMSVLDNLLVGAHLYLRHGLSSALALSRMSSQKEAVQQARRLLAEVGLEDRAEDPAGSLSYGDQRRVEIARALMTRPRFLFLDEPAAGMNPVETARLADLLRAVGDEGVGVGLVEHDMSLLMTVSHRVMALDRGQVVVVGSPDEVRRDPRVIDAYLGVGYGQ